jgi:hypothetical protein
MKWVLFYEDGTAYKGDPKKAPERGLVVIAQRRTDKTNLGPEILVGDWFAFHDGRWWNHSESAMWFELVRDADRFVCVRRGQYVDEPVFRDLMDKARSVIW